MEELDALLEELERSTLQDSDESSNPDPLPLDQHSRKESNLAETSETVSVQNDPSPLPVTFHLLEYLEHTCLSAFLRINCILLSKSRQKKTPHPPKTSAAAQLDELMAHIVWEMADPSCYLSPGFHEKDKKPYCRKDFLAMFSPKCGGCNRPVLENYLSAMDTVWHPECFVCGDCFSRVFLALAGRPFFELAGDVRLLRAGPITRPAAEGTGTGGGAEDGGHGCGQPITGRCISAMGHKFHPEHFVCAFCLTQLSKGIFREQDDKTYCQPCFTKLFPL
ncbi:leupaxin isoform X1 [Canis lupus familiaris]|uniref:leupaxin isoform X1 n=1 Tax=Canis lupus familiaris TaxID=9615 RepID=UPI0018F7DCFB|nr:leupaxin isoform X1 [Canis lupus familiaris]